MTEYVRARVPRDGAYDYATTTSAIHAASEGWDVLDEPTHDRTGAILPDARLDGRPIKPKVSVRDAATEKAATSASNTDNPPSIKE
ncbi:hypothetical protein EFK50_07855 [Nocardioides marmoriginsengisoli]|uniref:Uncharacterized protein n=1 Tax=Nocardioides marmoriginsengisoli TaxID=661483 RepID=A0A3N0CJK8_9ACTN|nr:hypothetical protein [Nocardioides marmoriginsengisoli]RNL63648.1 hypothetical protein EFK50_07855 [Nocardioides marmoriginsengisoli]